ncbi:hypothetical protein [Micromonospora sp. CA-244673]|uniref:hypothetical protein n=1 Tax=Micromonospora sp. CA-244673 TaxID=3239958 RepID=UPI003D8D065B
MSSRPWAAPRTTIDPDILPPSIAIMHVLAPYRQVPDDARRLEGELRFDAGAHYRVESPSYRFRWRRRQKPVHAAATTSGRQPRSHEDQGLRLKH